MPINLIWQLLVTDNVNEEGKLSSKWSLYFGGYGLYKLTPNALLLELGPSACVPYIDVIQGITSLNSISLHRIELVANSNSLWIKNSK